VYDTLYDTATTAVGQPYGLQAPYGGWRADGPPSCPARFAAILDWRLLLAMLQSPLGLAQLATSTLAVRGAGQWALAAVLWVHPSPTAHSRHGSQAVRQHQPRDQHRV
jgi:hypothetical protein